VISYLYFDDNKSLARRFNMKLRYVLAVLTVGVILAGCGTVDGDEGMSEMMSSEYLVTVSVNPGSSTPIAPVVWAVHQGDNPFLKEDMGKLEGLEQLAEDGSPEAVNKAVADFEMVKAHGIAAVPSGSDEPGPATPGHAYSFTITAHEGEYLSFAAMYVQSNDLFFSPGKMGIPLYEMKKPKSGDVTEMVMLYDAGTEKNEAPGEGMHQAPRQEMAGEGMTENEMIRPVGKVMDEYSYPAVDEILTVTITPKQM
jgi:hypothetical protein